jgi:hypothetical protein
LRALTSQTGFRGSYQTVDRRMSEADSWSRIYFSNILSAASTVKIQFYEVKKAPRTIFCLSERRERCSDKKAPEMNHVDDVQPTKIFIAFI